MTMFSFRPSSHGLLVVHSAYKFVASGIPLFYRTLRIDFRSPPLRMVTGQEEGS